MPTVPSFILLKRWALIALFVVWTGDLVNSAEVVGSTATWPDVVGMFSGSSCSRVQAATVFWPSVSHVDVTSVSHIDVASVSHVDVASVSHVDVATVSHVDVASVSHVDVATLSHSDVSVDEHSNDDVEI